MIVDSSAVIAILLGEPGWERLIAATRDTRCAVPTPVLAELRLVATKHGPDVVAATETWITRMGGYGADFVAFEKRHADLIGSARNLYGKGNGRGGLLNFGDLMVYAVAKQRGEPVLCTGRDFASTDIEIHPASRLDA